jgi:hypothetical protein
MSPVEKHAALEAARLAGIDLDLLDSNLALSPQERWRQHDGALELVLKLQEAREKLNAQLQPVARKTG